MHGAVLQQGNEGERRKPNHFTSSVLRELKNKHSKVELE